MISKELFTKTIAQLKENQEQARKIENFSETFFESVGNIVFTGFENSDAMMIELLASSFDNQDKVEGIEDILITWIYTDDFGHNNSLCINKPVVKDNKLVEWKVGSTPEQLYDYICSWIAERLFPEK